MATTINADKIVGSVIVTADASGVLDLQAAGVTLLTLDSAQVTVGNVPVSLGGNLTVTGVLSGDSATFSGPLVAGTLTASGLTYPSADGTAGFAVTTNGSGTLSFAKVKLTPIVITANTTAVAGNFYYLDSAGITLTLPASPDSGDQVGISEVAGDNTHIIARNGSNIMSDSSDLTLDIAYENFVLTYTGPSVGWAFSG